MIIPNIWENKIDVPNHQPDKNKLTKTNRQHWTHWVSPHRHIIHIIRTWSRQYHAGTNLLFHLGEAMPGTVAPPVNVDALQTLGGEIYWGKGRWGVP